MLFWAYQHCLIGKSEYHTFWRITFSSELRIMWFLSPIWRKFWELHLSSFAIFQIRPSRGPKLRRKISAIKVTKMERLHFISHGAHLSFHLPALLPSISQHNPIFFSPSPLQQHSISSILDFKPCLCLLAIISFTSIFKPPSQHSTEISTQASPTLDETNHPENLSKNWR